MLLLLGLIPVSLYLVFLILTDSFKLLNYKTIMVTAIWGLVSALLSQQITDWFTGYHDLSFRTYSRYFAPVLEEILKMLIFIWLIRGGKVGFMIDGAIYGFTTGAFFALFENIYYFYDPSNPNPMVWVIRGFGTAMMHGGATAIVLLFAMKALNTRHSLWTAIFRGTLLAMLIHSLFNHFFVNPVLSTILIILILPVVMVWIFVSHEKTLRKWLEVELETEVSLIRMIREGKFASTRTGDYIVSLKNRFSQEVIMDMLCYIDLYTDLSLKAKRIMLLKEAGFPVTIEPGTREKLQELKALEKQIGKAGKLAITPVLRMDQKDLWKLNLLEQTM